MTYKVDGVGGATVSDARSDRAPVCQRYNNILTSSDIVLIEVGRNDYNISGVGSDTSITGVDMQSAAFRAEYSISSTDVSHLNAKGMAYVLPKFEKILAEYYSDFISKK